MRDDDSSDWVKLSTVTHIDVATRNISRLAHAFHAAFLWKFWVDLPESKKNEFAHDRQSLSQKSGTKNTKFILISTLKVMPHLHCTVI